uniref:Uncharacterized protein n=1 Tax=Parastrongyloides trichosuri TaxID=131310 RepID=A0A0N4ZT36_PARTI
MPKNRHHFDNFIVWDFKEKNRHFPKAHSIKHPFVTIIFVSEVVYRQFIKVTSIKENTDKIPIREFIP